jgi:hypothetical protein
MASAVSRTMLRRGYATATSVRVSSIFRVGERATFMVRAWES